MRKDGFRRGGLFLYHGTSREAWERIRVVGLMPNLRCGILYLSPDAATAANFGDVVLRVRMSGQHLTAFEDCRDWELLCWEAIPAKDVSLC